MLEALIVSNIALWIVVVALAVVVVVLVRQIGVLHERIAPAGALVTGSDPKVGDRAPEFAVEDWAGALQKVGGVSADGKSALLFFLSPTCPVCKTLLPVLDSLRRAERSWLRIVLAGDGPREEHEAFVRAHGLEAYPYLRSTELVLAYRVGKLPYAVLVDAGGVIRAKGLVNTREHLESLFNAKEKGVGSVQEYLARQSGDRRVA
jgi:methylamine dehydrogenase accessory protein MauD